MAKGIFVGMVIAIVLGGCLGFGLAYIFPNQPEISEPDLSGKVIQTKCLSLGSEAVKNNNSWTKTELLNTNLNILTNGESYLVIRFTMNVRLVLSLDYIGLSRFIISIDVNGVSKANATIERFQDDLDPIPRPTWSSFPIAIEYITTSLAPALHTVNITWLSESNCICSPSYPIASQLITGTGGIYNLFNRTLIIQEIHL